MDLLEQVESVRSGQASGRELTEAALARIEAVNPQVNAFCAIDGESAMAQARALDARLAAGEDPGPLAGVPIGVKDLEDAAGFVTVYGDPAHADDPPATVDSIHASRYRKAGAIVLGKTNTPAYGFTAETDNLVFGPTRNPWSLERTSGGSSGGSAAAIASGMVALATGSDGGGSIRIPSEVCGLAGFKPTHGVVPNGDANPPTWSTFSTRGPMARTFPEIAYALDVVKGFHPRDMLAFDLPGSFAQAANEATVEGLTLAWSPTLGLSDAPSAGVLARCEEAVAALEGAGATVEEVPVVFEEPPIAAWLPIAARGSWRKLGPEEATWQERFLRPVTALPAAGRHIDADMIVDARAKMHRAGLALAAVFERFDLLVCPGMVGPPPKVREESPYGPTWAAGFTLPFNLTHVPAAVVPAGCVDEAGEELPVGVQIVGHRTADFRVMRAAAALEAILGYSSDRAPVHA